MDRLVVMHAGGLAGRLEGRYKRRLGAMKASKKGYRKNM